MDDEKAINTRYLALGGLQAVGDNYRLFRLSISHVAEVTGVSAQTVRTDLVRYFGNEWYLAAIKYRQAMRVPIPSVFQGRILSAGETFLALDQDDAPYARGELDASKAAVRILSTSGRVSSFRLGAKGLSSVLCRKGWAMVRLFETNSRLKEYHLGLYRIKPNNVPNEAGIDIYGILNDNAIVIYIFKSIETMGIRSLNLRFSRFARPSKYAYARERWDVLDDGGKL